MPALDYGMTSPHDLPAIAANPERVRRRTPGPLGTRGLQPYEYTFARWLATRKERPTEQEELDKLTELRQRVTSTARLRSLKRKPDFVLYFSRIAESPQSVAKTIIEDDYPFYARLHREAAEQLSTLGQFKEVAKFTVPILGQIFPRTAVGDGIQVTITLTPQQQQLLTAEPITEADYEVLPTPGSPE